MRNAAAISQRVTNAIVCILFKIGLQILNYLDDFAAAEKKENVKFAYCCLGAVLEKFGIEEAFDKTCPPSESMLICPGVLFNTITMTIDVTEGRLLEIKPKK